MKSMTVGEKEVSVEEAYRQAVASFGRGDRPAAKQALLLIVAAHPAFAPAFNALAIIAADEGELATATAFAERALDIDPAFDKAWNTLGTILLHQRNVEGAEEAFRRAIALDPHSAEGNANLGRVLMMRGKPAAATGFFQEAAQTRPEQWRFRFDLAVALEQADRLDDAETAYRQALDLNPRLADACLNIGTIRARGKDFVAAEEWYRRALEISPHFPAALHNLGNIFAETGRRREAEQAYRDTLALDPQNPAVLVALAELLNDREQPEEALVILRQTLSLPGDHLPALTAMSHALRKLRRFDEAGVCIDSALTLAPTSVHALNALATLRTDQGHYAEAEAALGKALESDPSSARTFTNLGFLLVSEGKAAEAVDALQKAAALAPDSPLVFCNLGLAYMKLEEPEKAMAAYERSLELDPGFPLTRVNLTIPLSRMGRVAEALESLKKIRNEGFESYGLLTNIGYCLSLLARPEEAVAAWKKALQLNPGAVEAHSNILYAMNVTTRFSAEDIFRESLAWDRAFAAPAPLHPAPRTGHGERLRVGYVSPDFRAHSVSFFCSPLFAAHDRQRVEVFCYADFPRPDSVTEHLRSLADVWREVHGMSDEALAALIRDDGIDILVDLAGHTSGNRLRMFTLKPAPVQVTWLGFPATTGLAAMNYRITDAVADPEGEADRLHTERLVRLPDGFLCYSPPAEAPPVPAAPCEERGYVTFGSFNNPAKMVPETLGLWSEVLRNVPGSRLFLKNKIFVEEKACQFFLGKLAEAGVEAKRVTFAPHTPSLAGHLGSYGSVDISLDTFPYNGTTTTCEALWMGVPVVTLSGDRHASRVGSSILTRLGLGELIAQTPEKFCAVTVALAGDREKLGRLRSNLRERMHASPLCDSSLFAGQMEAAYRQMWDDRS